MRRLTSSIRLAIWVGLVACTIALVPSQTRAQCFASGDFDGDGLFSVGDFVGMMHFIANFGPAPADLYECDLNGDCRVDALDLELFICIFEQGISCFPQYPVPTCCEPDTVRGACCVGIDSCTVLNPANCSVGFYQGDGIACGLNPDCPVLCGDVDHSGNISVSDIVYIIVCIFQCSPWDWLIIGDVDCNGMLTVSDAVYLVNYIFGGGSAPCANCD